MAPDAQPDGHAQDMKPLSITPVRPYETTGNAPAALPNAPPEKDEHVPGTYLISGRMSLADTRTVGAPNDATVRAYGLDSAFELWRTAKGSRPAPTWRDIDLLTFPAALRRGSMAADYDPARQDFFIRYWGEDLVRAFGVELSQKWLSESEHNGMMDSFAATAHLVAEDQQPQWLMHEITSPRGVRRTYPVLRLPLAADDSTPAGVMTIENIDMSLRDFGNG
jgi:hypothetical protein